MQKSADLMFSREKEPIGWIFFQYFLKRKYPFLDIYYVYVITIFIIYYKELAHAIMETGKSKTAEPMSLFESGGLKLL